MWENIDEEDAGSLKFWSAVICIVCIIVSFVFDYCANYVKNLIEEYQETIEDADYVVMEIVSIIPASIIFINNRLLQWVVTVETKSEKNHSLTE